LRIRFTSRLICWLGFYWWRATIVCAIGSAFLASKERPQWVWFAVLAVLAEIGGVVMLRAVDAHRLNGHM
jgi:hypothetical protein